jgi:hypothetical protein
MGVEKCTQERNHTISHFTSDVNADSLVITDKALYISIFTLAQLEMINTPYLRIRFLRLYNYQVCRGYTSNVRYENFYVCHKACTTTCILQTGRIFKDATRIITFPAICLVKSFNKLLATDDLFLVQLGL